jgi:hypothetical protein
MMMRIHMLESACSNVIHPASSCFERSLFQASKVFSRTKRHIGDGLFAKLNIGNPTAKLQGVVLDVNNLVIKALRCASKQPPLKNMIGQLATRLCMSMHVYAYMQYSLRIGSTQCCFSGRNAYSTAFPRDLDSCLVY